MRKAEAVTSARKQISREMKYRRFLYLILAQIWNILH